MLGYLTRLKKNRQGFTLIELMVVIVILGILAGVAVQSMGSGTTDKAKEARAKADLRTIVSALEIYKLNEGGDYPASDATPDFEIDLKPLVDEGYLKKIPSPPEGVTYAYSHTAAATTYTLTANGGGVSVDGTDL